jgi:hypothetical protein
MDDELVDGTDAMGPLELALNAALVLVAVAAVVIGLARSDPEAPPPKPSSSPQPTAAPDPASSCRTDAAGTVTCAEPGPFVESLQIRTYPSRQDLYAAYVREVEARTGRPFRGNTGDCSGSRSEGEVSWSLDRTKSRDFPLRSSRDGLLDPATEAAGRVFCTASGGDQATVIWTQDPFRLVTAEGSPAQRVTKWWVEAHLSLD